MPCVEITEADFDDLHHALGRPDPETLEEGECYRNYFATEAGSDWAKHAEATGLWDRITPDAAPRVTYRVNGDGKSALADWLALKGAEQQPRAPLNRGEDSRAEPSKTEQNQ